MAMNWKLLTLCVCFVTATLLPGQAQQSVPGGYSKAGVAGKEVTKAAAFAVKEEQKVMNQAAKDTAPVKLRLVKVLDAQQQVVAGMNYKLHMKVRLDGKAKEADAVVWWQSWRKPEPYQLTSWTWK